MRFSLEGSGQTYSSLQYTCSVWCEGFAPHTAGKTPTVWILMFSDMEKEMRQVPEFSPTPLHLEKFEHAAVGARISTNNQLFGFGGVEGSAGWLSLEGWEAVGETTPLPRRVINKK